MNGVGGMGAHQAIDDSIIRAPLPAIAGTGW